MNVHETNLSIDAVTTLMILPPVAVLHAPLGSICTCRPGHAGPMLEIVLVPEMVNTGFIGMVIELAEATVFVAKSSIPRLSLITQVVQLLPSFHWIGVVRAKK